MTSLTQINLSLRPRGGVLWGYPTSAALPGRAVTKIHRCTSYRILFYFEWKACSEVQVCQGWPLGWWALWQPVSKTAPNDSHLLGFMPLCSPLPFWIRDFPVWPTGYSRNDGMWLLRLDHNGSALQLLPWSLGLLTLGETSCHMVRTLSGRFMWKGAELGSQ